MQLSDLLTWQGYSGFAIIVAVLLSIIQISPIKINPWSVVAKWIGRAINSELMSEIKDIRKAQEESNDESAKQWAILARTHILRFDDELYNGVKHSKEYFVQQLADIDTYEEYCNSHPDFRNSCATVAIEHIRKVYSECLENHKFI